MKWAVAIAVTLAVAGLFVAVAQISGEIARQSTVDEAQPADIILVLGAAEYRGKPSPILRARLDHALSLYKKGLAPRILTTGGAGGDPVYTEGAVGRSYLVSQGVPSEAIVVEPEGESTVYSTAAAAEINPWCRPEPNRCSHGNCPRSAARRLSSCAMLERCGCR